MLSVRQVHKISFSSGQLRIKIDNIDQNCSHAVVKSVHRSLRWPSNGQFRLTDSVYSKLVYLRHIRVTASTGGLLFFNLFKANFTILRKETVEY